MILAASATILGAQLISSGAVLASEKARVASAKPSEGAARSKDALTTLRRAPTVLEDSFKTTASFSSKQLCHIAEGLVQKPTLERIDAIANYLSKDVHGWSDLMIERFLKSEPKAVKGMSKADLKATFLQKWQNNREKAQHWLEGCGVVVTALIAHGRSKFEHDSAQLLTDIASFIADGVSKQDPEAIAAAEALGHAEDHLKLLLKAAG
jgi:hypothetical protein